MQVPGVRMHDWDLDSISGTTLSESATFSESPAFQSRRDMRLPL